MIAKYNNISLAAGVPGLALQIGGRFWAASAAPVVTAADQTTVAIGMLAMLIGTVLLLVGLAYYALAKGRHPAWCLFAFLGLIGLIVLACLKDHHEQGEAKA